MFMPRVIIGKDAYSKLLNYINNTDFQYETGGVILGYRFLWTYYVIAFTFPRYSKNATRMTFVLNGEEHAEEIKLINKRFFFHPQLMGIWHSHTTEDDSFSLQDRESNKLLVKQFGKILSVIVICQKEKKGIHLTAYCISKNSRESVCKVITDIRKI